MVFNDFVVDTEITAIGAVSKVPPSCHIERSEISTSLQWRIFYFVPYDSFSRGVIPSEVEESSFAASGDSSTSLGMTNNKGFYFHRPFLFGHKILTQNGI